MRALLAKLCADGAGDQSHVVEAFYSVFGALLTERAQQANQIANPDRLIVQRALTIIADRFSDPDFTTQHLAELTGISLRRMQRAFQVIDETPHERLQSYRIAAAHMMLRNAQTKALKTTITAIAYDSGFSDLSTFYRLYRKVHGHAPGQDLLT
jgi:AraC-like DNA-binding protein